MGTNKILDEQTIGDILLCEPITKKGKDSLERLGLSANEITHDYFYNFLRVPSKYDNDISRGNTINNPKDLGVLYYGYTIDGLQFKASQEQLKQFDIKFESNSSNECPLLILGVAGNGKSIEVNRRIWEITNTQNDFGSCNAYLDLEEAFTKITYGITFECNKTPLELFHIKLLNGIMDYLKYCSNICPKIYNNFLEIFVKANLANEKQKAFFQSIGCYKASDNKSEETVFSTLLMLAKTNDIEKDIRSLLEMFLWIMHCSNPEKKKYLIVDNIEQYIRLNNSKIQIHNSDIKKIYDAINNVVINMINDYERIEKGGIGWRKFKIIVALRRTSLVFLDPTMLHSPIKSDQNAIDLTGHIQLSDIWRKKKSYIWESYLKKHYESQENDDIIRIVDDVMNDDVESIGTSYQLIISALMSYGIRRNSRAQAHAAYSAYEMLTAGPKDLCCNNATCIDLDRYKFLMQEEHEHSSTRYMFRRALIEFQLKWSVSSGSQLRWQKLGIGHLTDSYTHTYNGIRFAAQRVEYFDDNHISLVRRILSYLSYFPDEDSKYDNGHHKSVVDMFATKSLFDLIKGVLKCPDCKNDITDDDLLQLARVLIALGDMSNGDTRCAPYIILGVNDPIFDNEASEENLSNILKKIWEAGSQNSLKGEAYDCSNFGARITNSGYSFLLDWQPSFSFIASLYCFTIPPLFFLKDINIIQYVIEKVYTASEQLCELYEKEAKCFCGGNLTLKTKKYLPMHNKKYVTFRQRVKDLHINHLNLYRDYIEKNYRTLLISEENMNKLASRENGYISSFINKYAKWKTEEGALECF